jgi:hypothetical protein
MPLTVTYPAHPNQTITEFTLGPWKARMVRLQFDSSYLTTGEVLAASTLGWSNVYGAIPLTNVGNADGTLSLGCVVRSNAAQTSLTFQAQEGGGTANDNPFKEVTSTQDVSAYHGTFFVLGS